MSDMIQTFDLTPPFLTYLNSYLAFSYTSEKPITSNVELVYPKMASKWLRSAKLVGVSFKNPPFLQDILFLKPGNSITKFLPLTKIRNI